MGRALPLKQKRPLLKRRPPLLPPLPVEAAAAVSPPLALLPLMEMGTEREWRNRPVGGHNCVGIEGWHCVQFPKFSQGSAFM